MLKPINHGTTGGYQTELYRGIETCRECKDAWAADQRRRKRANKLNPLRKKDGE